MLTGPTYSIGLHFMDEHWQITIKELGICATAIHARTFDDASKVADYLLVAALLPTEQEKERRRREKSAA